MHCRQWTVDHARNDTVALLSLSIDTKQADGPIKEAGLALEVKE